MNYCITAPGTDLKSSASNTVLDGTSFAAPIVSAAIAVIREAFPYMKSNEITNLLFTTARDLGASGVDAIYGHGNPPPDVPPVWSCPWPCAFATSRRHPKRLWVSTGSWGCGEDAPGWTGRCPGQGLPWFCPPDLPLAHPTLQICHPRAGPVL